MVATFRAEMARTGETEHADALIAEFSEASPGLDPYLQQR